MRIWKYPHVKVGNRYPMEDGHIEVDSIEEIAIQDIHHGLAAESGFLGVIDLLKTAKHGRATTSTSSGSTSYARHSLPPGSSAQPDPIGLSHAC